MENKVLMPRLGVNDDTVTLGQWLIKHGDQVQAGQSIAVIETSKETSELKAEASGYISICVPRGMEVAVGETIAMICEEPIRDTGKQPDGQPEDTRTYTRKAKALLDAHPEIDLSKLPREGIIKENDIEKLIPKSFHLEDTLNNHILIYGRGGLCKDIIDIVGQTNAFQIGGIVDFYYPQDKELYGIPVVGGVKELKSLYGKGYHKMISAVAFWGESYTKHYRKNPTLRIKQMGFELVNIVDRSANIARTARMGEGNLICANTFIGPDARIGSDVILNVGSVVNHDCIVSDHCHIATGAILAGEVIVGENSLVGQGAVIHAGVKIGSNVTINNGCRIFRNVPDGAIVSK